MELRWFPWRGSVREGWELVDWRLGELSDAGMSFRDDREAAHRRADALEQELRRTQAELEQMRAPRRQRLVGVAVVAGIAVGLGAMGAVFWTVQRGAAESQAAAEARAAREQAAQAAEAAIAQVRAREQQAAAEAAREAERAREAQAAVPQEAPAAAARVVWRASVDEATGITLPAGAPCTVAGEFAPGGQGGAARGLTIACGGQEIYRAGPGEAAGATSSLREGPVHGGAGRVYLLSYRDERPAQPTMVRVSTLGHTARVWREGERPMQVTLFVHDVSEAREGDALGGRSPSRQPSFAGVVERAARVASVRGRGPVSAGARCSFAVRPVWEFPENCRVALRCGTTWLYGAREAGYLTCEVQGGRPVAALDENTTDHGGDPRLSWRGRRVVVSDFTEAGEWSVDLAL